MTKKQRKKTFKDFFQKFAVFFTITVLVLSAVVLIITNVNFKEYDFSKLITSDKTNFLYRYILIPAGVIFLLILLFFITRAMIRKRRNRYKELFKHHHIYHRKKLV